MMVAVNPMDIIKGGYDIIASVREKLQKAKDGSWEEIVVSLEAIRSLSSLHMNTIAVVVRPVLEQDDISSTCDRYHALVYDPIFPEGYGLARGKLEAALILEQFRKETVKEAIKEVLMRLGEFQHAAFMLAYDTFLMADGVMSAKTLWTLLSADVPEETSKIDALKRTVAKCFKEAFDWLADETRRQRGFREPEEPPPVIKLDKAADVVKLLSDWCQAWQRHVSRTLVEGRGLSYAIGQLEMYQHK